MSSVEPEIEYKFFPDQRPDLIVGREVTKVKNSTVRNIVPLGTSGKIIDVKSYKREPDLGDTVWVVWSTGLESIYSGVDLDCLKVK